MTRRRLTPKQRATLARQYENRCASCRDPLGDVWHADHIWQLALGGGNDLENFRPLCVPCHVGKSKADALGRAKVRRLTGANKPRTKRPIPSRPFRKDIRRRMDGTVKRREA